MLTNRYYRTLALLIFSLVVLIEVFAIILFHQGPRVRIVSFDNDPQVAALNENSVITVRFDRPLTQKDYTKQIHFTPEVAFRAQTSTQTISITLLDNFQRNTDYLLEIGPQILDTNARTMSSSYQQIIATGQPSYVYIERNYPSTDDTSTSTADKVDDHLKLAAPETEPQILFSAPEITSFAANRDYAVVASRGEDKDQLAIVDLDSKEQQEVDLLFDGRINHLSLSARGSVALFTVTPDFDMVSREYYDQFANRVEALDLQTGRTTSLTNANGDYLRAFSIQLDNDGQVALIQDQDQAFYAVSPFNDYDPVLVGTHATAFGFFDSASEIIFRNNEEFVRFDVSSGETSPIDFNLSGFVQAFDEKNDTTYASSTTFFAGESQDFLYALNDWADREPKQLWTSQELLDQNLRGFSVSYDGALLALQLDPEGCRFDTVLPNSQCQQVHTVIFDHTNQTVVSDFVGFDLVWLP